MRWSAPARPSRRFRFSGVDENCTSDDFPPWNPGQVGLTACGGTGRKGLTNDDGGNDIASRC